MSVLHHHIRYLLINIGCLCILLTSPIAVVAFPNQIGMGITADFLFPNLGFAVLPTWFCLSCIIILSNTNHCPLNTSILALSIIMLSLFIALMSLTFFYNQEEYLQQHEHPFYCEGAFNTFVGITLWIGSTLALAHSPYRLIVFFISFFVSCTILTYVAINKKDLRSIFASIAGGILATTLFFVVYFISFHLYY